MAEGSESVRAEASGGGLEITPTWPPVTRFTRRSPASRATLTCEWVS